MAAWSSSGVLGPRRAGDRQGRALLRAPGLRAAAAVWHAAPGRQRPGAAQVAVALAAARSDRDRARARRPRARAPGSLRSGSRRCSARRLTSRRSVSTLHLWPGELKAQAEHLYAGGHAENLCELLRTGRPRRLAGQSRNRCSGFRNAPVRTRVYLTCGLDPGEYARRWQGEDWKKVGAHHRNHIAPDLWPWLLGARLCLRAGTARLDPFLHALGTTLRAPAPQHPRVALVGLERSRAPRRRGSARRARSTMRSTACSDCWKSRNCSDLQPTRRG